MSKSIAYVRVSTIDQNLDRQMIAMSEYGIPKENIFADHGFSGKDFNRPAYQAMISALEPGDTLVVKSVDRLGRNFDEMIDEWNRITKKLHVSIVVLDMPYLNASCDIADLMTKMINAVMVNMSSGFAEMERVKIHERQMEGIAAAKARGVHCGRPRKEPGDDFLFLKAQY